MEVILLEYFLFTVNIRSNESKSELHSYLRDDDEQDN